MVGYTNFRQRTGKMIKKTQESERRKNRQGSRLKEVEWEK